MLFFQGDIQSNGMDCKSTNPFDYPYDESDVDHNNMVCHAQ